MRKLNYSNGESTLSPDEAEAQERFAKLRLFVGDNADTYMQKWAIMVLSGRRLTWNWAAFLFTWVWFAYRKMYFMAASLLVLHTLLELLAPTYFTITWLATAILSAIFANYIYFRRVTKKVNIIELTTFDPDLQIVKLYRKGGTSWWGVIIFFIIAFLMALLVPYTEPTPEYYPGIEGLGI